MSRATETTRFEVEPFRAKPVARVTPEEATGVIGTRILFSGAGSTVEGRYDGLTLYWELTVKPDGSSAAGRKHGDMNHSHHVPSRCVFVIIKQFTPSID